MRRSLLFLPGNNPGMLQSGGVFEADGVILDLEDAVSPLEKDAARLLVAQALRKVDYRGSQKIVRINPLSAGGAADIRAIVPCAPDALLLPKSECVQDLLAQLAFIEQAQQPGQKAVEVILLIETPLGLARVNELACVHPAVVALAFGAEDYTAALGAVRSKEGGEILAARSLLVNAAAAAGIESIDTPFTDAQDEEGLLKDTLLAKNMGFKGKLAINPRQVDIIHSAFNPSEGEVDWAERVIEALATAKQQGSGVVSVDGKMVDAPVAIRAERIIKLAKKIQPEQEASK